MMVRRRGFTLIELLVVIAIIGILAAMLFPVFARARESARKIQCLSNVKNIAMAIQMYLTDYDAFPPNNHDQAVLAWLDSVSDDGHGCSRNGSSRFNGANPFLRWQVILDEYTKNRSVWLCPSAQRVGDAYWIVPNYTSVWWYYLRDNGFGCCGPCGHAWPPGWGGTITDSIKQEALAFDEPTGFKMSIGVTSTALAGRPLAEVDDPASWVVCGDGNQGEELQQMWGAAYGGDPNCCWDLEGEDIYKFNTDVSFRKKYAPHMGGLNLGFADGHAKWWDAEAAVLEAGVCRCHYTTGPGYDGEDADPGNPDCHGLGEDHKSLKGTCPDFEVINVPG